MDVKSRNKAAAGRSAARLTHTHTHTLIHTYVHGINVLSCVHVHTYICVLRSSLLPQQQPPSPPSSAAAGCSIGRFLAPKERHSRLEVGREHNDAHFGIVQTVTFRIRCSEAEK